MKLAKLSLAAIAAVSLSTGVFAADSLTAALTGGKVSGQLQGVYFNKDNGTTTHDILDLGIDLTYVTGSFNGFNAGFTFQSTHSPWVNSADAAAFSGDMYGTGSVLSEAYLQYANSGFFVKAGRQYISTPLVAGSGSRTTKEAFEGYVAGYTGLADTVIAGGYVTKYQHRTDGSGHIGQFEDVADGAWTIFATNKSIKGLKLTAAYAKVKDPGKNPRVWFAEGVYSTMVNDVKVGFAALYYDSTSDQPDSVGANGDTLSLKVSAAYNGLYGHIAYNTNDNKSDTLPGLGNGADNAYAGGLIYGNNYGADVDTIGVKVAYDFSKVGVAGLKAGVMYSDYDTGAANADYNTLGGYVSYAFAGGLKGLSTTFKYDTKNVDNGNDKDYTRIYVTYKF